MQKSQFDSITLTFDHGDGAGPKSYTIPPDKVFGAIEVIEEVITLKELSSSVARNGNPPLARISRAYASVLRYAGARVEDQQVYIGMFSGGEDDIKGVVAAVNGLLALMIPPSAVTEAAKRLEEETGKPGELTQEGIRAVV
jgi:hypothetical protein